MEEQPCDGTEEDPRAGTGKHPSGSDGPVGPMVTVFRSRLRPDAEELGYRDLAAHMEARARAMPGFVDFKTFTAADGERLSLVTFDSVKHQRAWREDPEHREAQGRGRRDFYQEYDISVCVRQDRRTFSNPGGQAPEQPEQPEQPEPGAGRNQAPICPVPPIPPVPPAPDPAGPREEVLDRFDPGLRRWCAEAVRRIDAEVNRSSDTHLLAVPLPETWNVDLYLKDESTHPSGSLKHRLARSLFLYALCNGWLKPGMPVIEASSGSTAVSEAYFAQLIGVPFVAVMAKDTSAQKVEWIEREGGSCHFVEHPGDVYEEARKLAAETGGHYMDQFTYAERATDWRGNNNIAESIFAQMSQERYPEPAWIVATAGTGGTSATIARYVRYTGRATAVCVADPENSAFFPGWKTGDAGVTTAVGSRIEGIGRQRVEPSFVGTAIDRMVRVPDAAAVASIRFLEEITGRRAGGSTGTGLWAALRIVSEMIGDGRKGSVVGLLCDPGDRYTDRYYSDAWLAGQGLDIAPYLARLREFAGTGQLGAV